MTREERYEIYNGTAKAIVSELDRLIEAKDRLAKLPKVKPQVLIDDDDEYQENLEISYERRECLDIITECNESIIDNIAFFSENGLLMAFKDWLVFTCQEDRIQKLTNLGFKL